jgi:hypothetical protein
MPLDGPQQSHLKFLKVTAEILDSRDFAVHQRQITQFREMLDVLRVEVGVGPMAEREFFDLSPETVMFSWVNTSGYYMHHQL